MHESYCIILTPRAPRTGLGAETKAMSEKQTEKLALHDSDSVYVSADRSWKERGANSGMGWDI